MITRRRNVRGYSAVAVLTVYLCCLLLIPARQVLAPLGGVGAPQLLLGLGMLGLWVLSRLRGDEGAPRSEVKIALGVVLVCVTVSLIVAMRRPIAAEEMTTATQGYLGLLSWSGVLLFTTDLIPDREALLTVFRRLSLIGGILGVLAVLQFVTGQLLVDRLWIPGLSQAPDQMLGAVSERGGLNRPAGTAVHPIEFGAVISTILPLALTTAIHDRHRNALRRWFPVSVLGLATFLTVSRSALLATGVAALVLWWRFPRAWKLRSAVLGLGFLIAIAIGIPGMLGTLIGLFTGIGNDSSAASRTAAYPIAWSFIERSPFVGRGFATFLPQIHILDNAYLGLMIEVGFVGFFAVLALMAAGMQSGQVARRTAVDGDMLAIGQAITASVAAAAVGLALYDGFGFPMGAAIVFVALGLAGATRRISAEERSALPPARRGGARSSADESAALPSVRRP